MYKMSSRGITKWPPLGGWLLYCNGIHELILINLFVKVFSSNTSNNWMRNDEALHRQQPRQDISPMQHLRQGT